MGPPWKTQLCGNTGIPQTCQLQTERPFSVLHHPTLPPLQFSAVLDLLYTNIHSLITDITTNHSFLSLLASFLNLFSTCSSSFSLVCYVLSLINKCLIAADLWFAKTSPPYGSGEAILVFLVCSSPKNVISLGKGKNKIKKKERKSSPSYQNPFIHF